MVPSNLTIVCYAGGTCGDLLTAIIDNKDVSFNFMYKTVIHKDNRQKLKKPHLFGNDHEKDQYLIEVAQQYNSIPSHDLKYHISKSHNFLSIVVDDIKTAQWAANRFKYLHRPHVWQEMAKASGANTIDEYAQLLINYSNMIRDYSDKYVSLESIKDGTVISKLEKILQITINKDGKNIYRNWIINQMGL